MKKILYLLLVFSITFSACKKDKQKTDNQDNNKTNTEQVLKDSQQNITQNNTTKQQKNITVATVDDAVNLIKKQHFDNLISDSVFVLNNKMSMQHIDNYSKNEAVKQLNFIDPSLPVFKDEEPVFDGEVFEKSGFFVHDKKYEIIGEWTDAKPEIKQKAADLEKKITKVIEYVNEDTDVKIYLTKDKNGYKIGMIDISTPGEI